ncbi:MAG: BON domain-containing protein [Rubrivirga sp.]
MEKRLSLRSRTTADRSLAKRLRAGVENASVGSAGIAFYVHDGAVSMYGSVASEQVREDLIAVASAQPGIRRIVDHLSVIDA